MGQKLSTSLKQQSRSKGLDIPSRPLMIESAPPGTSGTYPTHYQGSPPAPPPYEHQAQSATGIPLPEYSPQSPSPTTMASPPKRVFRIDPRLTTRHRSHPSRAPHAIPPSILELICSYLPQSPATLAVIALLSRDSYDVAIPFLYRSIPFSRGTVNSLFWAVDLPPSTRFLYSPSSSSFSPGSGSASPPQITDTVRQRRKRCLSLVRDVHIKGDLVDINFCEVLSQVEDVLFPNLRTVTIDPGVLAAMAYYDYIQVCNAEDTTVHAQLAAVQRLFRPAHLVVTSGLSHRPIPRECSVKRQYLIAKETIEVLGRAWSVESVTWHGLTGESLPYVLGAEHHFHFVDPAMFAYAYSNGTVVPGQTPDKRIDSIRTALRGANTGRVESTRWKIFGPGLIRPNVTTENEQEVHELILSVVCDGDSTHPTPLSETLKESIEWFTSEQARQVGTGCGCYLSHDEEEHAEVSPARYQDTGYGVNVAKGVRRSVWDPKTAWKVRDARA